MIFCGFEFIFLSLGSGAEGLTTRTERRLLLRTYSQGGVEFPTGGDSALPKSPRALLVVQEVSRSGVIPEPTVTVRMEEDKAVSPREGLSTLAGCSRHVSGCLFYALILVP